MTEQVRDNPAASRFELDYPGGPAIAVYDRQDDMLVFTHTEVPTQAEGHGIGSRLIAGALAEVRARGLRVDPACPFVADYIDRHPEWRDLLVADAG